MKKTVKLNITFGDKKPNDIVEIDAKLAEVFLKNGNASEVSEEKSVKDDSKAKISELEAQLAEKDAKIAELEAQLAEKDAKVDKKPKAE